MAFNIADFHSTFKFDGARPTLFEIIITNPPGIPGLDLSDFRVRCKAASIPNLTVGTIEVPYMGRKTKHAGDRTYDTWTTTCMVDEDFISRNAIERWNLFLNSPVQNIRATPTASPSEYKATALVTQYSKTGPIIAQYRMINCWPSTVDQIELSWENNNQVMEFQVTWEFDWWENQETALVDSITP